MLWHVGMCALPRCLSASVRLAMACARVVFESLSLCAFGPSIPLIQTQNNQITPKQNDPQQVRDWQASQQIWP